MSDYIKREDAIKIIQRNIDWSYADDEISAFAVLKSAEREIQELPSADVVEQSEIDSIVQTIVALERMGNNERKRGEWVKDNGRKGSVTWWYSCNQCGSAGDKTDNFCKNCGADMRGED